MKIDSVNISTFGLTLLEDPKLFGLPKRKNIIDIPAFTANDIKLESISGTVILFGNYASAAAMETALANFQTLIKNVVKHTIEFDDYNLPEMSQAVFPDGYKVDTIRTVAKITMKVEFANQKGVL